MKKITVLTSIFFCSILLAKESTPISLLEHVSDRLIVKYKSGKKLTSNDVGIISNRSTLGSSGIKMNFIRQGATGANILNITIDGKKPSLEQLQNLANKIKEDPNVQYAEPDLLVFPAATPLNSYYSTHQWALHGEPGGINIEEAWDFTQGDSNTTIAVIDSGVLNHPNLSGRLLPGYDFVSDPKHGSDGDGRDDNASDPGSYYTDSFGNFYPSNWHGTHVAGVIAANTSFDTFTTGIAGINPSAKILPVRVLGRGGSNSYSSDIIDGMLWAAGITVEGVPENPNPAKILNLSLGSVYSDCPQHYIDAINQVVAKNGIIVTAAMNYNFPAQYTTPANCDNVITVGATSFEGGRADYSNYGSPIDIMAPGGDDSIDAPNYGTPSIFSTVDSSPTTPLFDNTHKGMDGTSMAAPHVAGVVSLITSSGFLPDANISLVNYILQASARPHPIGTSNDCLLDECGGGLLDAGAALNFIKNVADYTPKYSDYLIDKVYYEYDFSSPVHKLDRDSQWYIEDGKLYSNPIGDNESTSYNLSINDGNIVRYGIEFDYGISSELGYDSIHYITSNARYWRQSGSHTDSFAYNNMPPKHGDISIQWSYEKDDTVSMGDDRAWIDNITLAAYKRTNSTFFTDEIYWKIIEIKNMGYNELTMENFTITNEDDFFVDIGSCATPIQSLEKCEIEIIHMGELGTEASTTISYTTNDSANPSVEKTFTFTPNKKNNFIVPIINYLLF